MVVLERPIGWKFFSLEFFLESVFKKKIDLVTQNALKEQLKSQILKQVIKFKQDYKTVDAVIRNFEVIGEAAKNIPQDFKTIHPDLPWSELYLLRNKVSHEYFGVDYDIIRDIADNYLPQNKLRIKQSIEEENS